MPKLQPVRDPVDVALGVGAGLLIWGGIALGLFAVLVWLRGAVR